MKHDCHPPPYNHPDCHFCNRSFIIIILVVIVINVFVVIVINVFVVVINIIIITKSHCYHGHHYNNSSIRMIRNRSELHLTDE